MAKKPPPPRLDVLAKAMYRLLIQCGMHLDGEGEWNPDDLREAVAALVLEMDGYYMRQQEVSDGMGQASDD